MRKDWSEIQKIVDSCVFHYTNVGTLAGMLRNASKKNDLMTFWASHVFYMNDSKEMKYGEEKIWDVLYDVESELSIPKRQRITELDKEELEKFIYNESINENSLTNMYSISFSKSFDYLPMWNMYGQNGNGICLGFDMTILDKFLKSANMGSLAIMKYGIGEDIDNLEKAQEEMMIWKKYVKLIYQSHKKFIEEHLEAEQENSIDSDKFIALTLYVSLLAFLPGQIKNPAYEYEQEYRLYCREFGNKVHYRDSNGLLIPYVEVKLPLSALKLVVVGPTSDSNRQMMSIAKLLKAKVKDFNALTFYSSEIPYRL